MKGNFFFNFWKWSKCYYNIFINKLNQLVELYNNTYVVNYLAYIYSNCF